MFASLWFAFAFGLEMKMAGAKRSIITGRTCVKRKIFLLGGQSIQKMGLDFQASCVEKEWAELSNGTGKGIETACQRRYDVQAENQHQTLQTLSLIPGLSAERF